MYEIEFLKEVEVTNGGNVNKKHAGNIFGEGEELTRIARNWKILGFKRVESIEVAKGARKSYDEVVEMFYPEVRVLDGAKIPLDEEERQIKANLLSAGKKTSTAHKANTPPAGPTQGEPDKPQPGNDPAKQVRADLFAAAKKLVDAGKLPKMPPKNTGTARLKEIVDNANN